VTQGARIGRADVDRFCESALAGGTHTNYFRGAEALYGYAGRGCLYTTKSETGEFILADAGGFYRLYYTLHNLSGPPFIDETGAPVVAEIAYRGNNLPPEAGYFISCGFQNSLARVRLQLRVSDLLSMSLQTAGNNPNPPHSQGSSEGGANPQSSQGEREETEYPQDTKIAPEAGTVSTGKNLGTQTTQPDLADQAFHLFSSAFDKLTGCIPDMTELPEASEEGRLFTVSGNGTLDGALLCEDTGASSLLRIVAVKPEMRSRGVGSQLVSAWVSRCMATGKRVMSIWVAEDNHSALRLYENYGFNRDGMRSAVLIKYP